MKSIISRFLRCRWMEVRFHECVVGIVSTTIYHIIVSVDVIYTNTDVIVAYEKPDDLLRLS